MKKEIEFDRTLFQLYDCMLIRRKTSTKEIIEKVRLFYPYHGLLRLQLPKYALIKILIS